MDAPYIVSSSMTLSKGKQKGCIAYAVKVCTESDGLYEISGKLSSKKIKLKIIKGEKDIQDFESCDFLLNHIKHVQNVLMSGNLYKLEERLIEILYLNRLKEDKFSDLFKALNIDVAALADACKIEMLDNGLIGRNILRYNGLLDRAFIAYEVWMGDDELDDDEIHDYYYCFEVLLEGIEDLLIAVNHCHDKFYNES